MILILLWSEKTPLFIVGIKGGAEKKCMIIPIRSLFIKFHNFWHNPSQKKINRDTNPFLCDIRKGIFATHDVFFQSLGFRLKIAMFQGINLFLQENIFMDDISSSQCQMAKSFLNLFFSSGKFSTFFIIILVNTGTTVSELKTI